MGDCARCQGFLYLLCAKVQRITGENRMSTCAMFSMKVHCLSHILHLPSILNCATTIKPYLSASAQCFDLCHACYRWQIIPDSCLCIVRARFSRQKTRPTRRNKVRAIIGSEFEAAETAEAAVSAYAAR